MEHLIHRDDVGPVVIDRGPLQCTRWSLRKPAGLRRIGLSRYVVPPGQLMMPPHAHADEEELFFVLAGDGATLLGERAHAVRAGDAIAYASDGPAHTIVAGDDGIELLAFAEGSRTNLTYLPRSRSWWLGPRWLPADGPPPFALEAELGPVELPDPSPRPRGIAGVADVEGDEDVRDGYRGVETDLGRATGSIETGLRHVVLQPGQLGCPPHWHAVEEEVFVVLDGDGRAWLGDERAPVRPGHVLGRPANTAIPHALEAGPGGLTYLAYGHRAGNELCFYPRSGKVWIGGRTYRLTPVDDLDGER